jgi:replicative DNA helicase Mcm
MLSETEADAIHSFLRNYYKNEIAALCKQWPGEKESLTIEYMDLFRADIYDEHNIADVLTENPDKVFKDLREIAGEYDYPVDMDIKPEIQIQGAEYERTVENLRSDDMGKYVTVRGQVNQLTQVEPKPVNAVFLCRQCSNRKEVLQTKSHIEHPAEDCQACGFFTGWELNDAATSWMDHQVIELASLPEDTGGQVSDKIRVEVTDDLAGVVSAGDRIKVSGVVNTEKDDIETENYPDARRPIYLDGRAIQSEQESFAEIEPSRIDEIKELAERDDIYDALVDSFAPHIHTDDDGDIQKLSIILALFGGVQKQLDTGSQIRGNINVLLIGDGGTAKSQFLQTAEKLAPKSVLASGKGATAAGLTATAEQSNLTGEWSLKAGALVMANNGVACIDEFDKMDNSARKSIHEALENQAVPVTKAGINTTLPAKTAVIAAANPAGGEFDRFYALSEQIEMEQPLISRFDLIFGLADKQDEARDETIAQTQHDIAAGDVEATPEISYDLLREYIAYARQIEPSYASQDVKQTLIDYYVDIRKKADDGDEPGPRMNDALRRIAQASARVRLSDTIDQQDAQRAIDLLNYTIGQVALDEKGNISGSQYDGGKDDGNDYDQLKPEILKTLDRDGPLLPDELARMLGEDETRVRDALAHYKKRGDVIDRQGRYETP